jgi:FlgD Ig-like domain/Peptidase C13 family
MALRRPPVSLLQLFCVLFSVSLFTGVAAAADVTIDDAVAITTDHLLGGSTDGVRLFYYPQAIESREPIRDWRDRTFLEAPEKGWFVFVDLHPGANWEHPCYYVFVSEKTGALTKVDAMTPPRLQPQLIETTDGFDNPSPEASAKMHAWFDEALRNAPKAPIQNRGMTKALIISGGANQSNNHIRYWNDCSFIYKTLVNYYGYLDENIWVCISDGLNPAVDISDGTNSNPDLDGDGDDDIMYPATLTYIQQVFTELANTLSPSDQLFIFTTDHGGTDGGWDAYLNLWNSEILSDDAMATMIDALPCETVICTYEQCFSGGMLDDLWGVDGRVLSSGARHDEYSWAMPPDYIYDTYVYHWTCAVAWQDPNGNPIDADSNDDGFVSMREAFLWAEAHDFDDETPQYYSTPESLGEIMNLMGNLEGVYLALEDVVIDDDNNGASVGNNNGIIEYGETVEIWVTLSNMGQTDASGVVGTMNVGSIFAGASSADVNFGTVLSEGTAGGSTPYVVQITNNVPDNEDLQITIELSEEPGMIALDLSARAPSFLIGISNIDDSTGDDDGIPDPGELVSVTFSIQNIGCPTPDLTAVLASVPELIVPDPTPQALGVIGEGETIYTGDFEVRIDDACPEIFCHYLVLEIDAASGYYVNLPVPFSVGQIFKDTMEQGSAAWTHYAGPGGTFIDQWHLDTYRNHTVGGSSAWKVGGVGAAAYDNLNYSVLETAEFDLPPNAVLSFWHWMDAEFSSYWEGYAYDGGLLEISTDGGFIWQPLMPEGGYPYLVRAGGTPGPFAAETPIWSGQHDWQKVEVDLSAYSGAVKLRFAFGSDGATTAEGWYVDDVEILTALPSDAADLDLTRIVRPLLLGLGPNPMQMSAGNAGLTIRFALPAAGEANLAIYDPAGRLVRNLLSQSVTHGVHSARWDGTDSEGYLVPSGAYFCRLSVDGNDSIKRVTVIR